MPTLPGYFVWSTGEGSTAGNNQWILGDTPYGIAVDYQGHQRDDILIHSLDSPIVSHSESEVIAMIENALLSGYMPVFYRLNHRIYLRLGAL